MPQDQIWMVRAGRQAAFVDDFVSGGLVAIGWPKVGSVPRSITKPDLTRLMNAAYPDAKPGTRAVWVSNILRFLQAVDVGHEVVTYDPQQRLYFLGKVRSDVEWREHALPRVRKVEWQAQVERQVLSSATRNSLGSIVTLFQVSAEASTELRAKATPIGSMPAASSSDESADEEGEAVLLADVAIRSDEFIEDRIARLDWEDLQELVAGILRAMGYRTKVSEGGPDRGVDIFASPDGLGLQEPRILVEVKHRAHTQMDSQAIRAFIGARKSGDRCLYVSTGGFSKDAKYEAERAPVPIRLITLPTLRELLVEHYENLDPATSALVPLRRLYWPVD